MPFSVNFPARDDGWVRIRCHRGVVVISLTGHLDAHNASRLFELLGRFAPLRNGVILALSALDYCGVAGLRMLIAVGGGYFRLQKPWALIPGPVPARLLILTPHLAVMPIADTIDAAATMLCRPTPPSGLGVIR